MSVPGISLYGSSLYAGYSGYGYTSTSAANAAQASMSGTASAVVLGSSSRPSGTAVVGDTGRMPRTADMQMLKRTGQIECQTCKNRTYQDGSNDMGVSFKTPGHIDPAVSGAVVRSHEQEHVTNERAQANMKGRRVVSQSVTLSTSVCSECGRSYVSGGTTRTTTVSDKSRNKAVSAYNAAKSIAGQGIDQSA